MQTTERRWIRVFLFGILWGCVDTAPRIRAAEPASSEAASAVPSRTGTDPQALADAIDAIISARWAETKTVPAESASDAEFYRRVSLHVSGCIPPVGDARRFLEDPAPGKRQRAIDELLDGPGYIVNFTHFWRDILLPPDTADFQLRFAGLTFEAWLRQRMADETPYDEIARQIVNLDLTAKTGGRRIYGVGDGTPSPLAFYQTRRSAPENLAAASSRIFLGVRIECAQCHDHPFDEWKREQFWSQAAFFGGMIRSTDNNDFQVQEVRDRHEITIPDTKRVVQAAFLDGTSPEWQSKSRAREILAGWITSRNNPYFARAAANRMWGHFFGVGIVHPLDDMSERNPPSHPKLLDLLAAELADHHFDMKFLIRAITLSKTYQLSSRGAASGSDSPRLFARMSVQGLTSAQILESLLEAVGAERNALRSNPNIGVVRQERADIDETFAADDQSKTDRETTVLQALALMNGQLVAAATSEGAARSGGNRIEARTLAAVLNAPFLNTEERIETLYLATLTRKPTPEELQRLKAYVDGGGQRKKSPKPAGDVFRSLLAGSGNARHAALADVFWALLNCSEFLMNH